MSGAARQRQETLTRAQHFGGGGKNSAIKGNHILMKYFKNQN